MSRGASPYRCFLPELFLLFVEVRKPACERVAVNAQQPGGLFLVSAGAGQLFIGMHFWLAFIGVLIYGVSLSIGGTLQGLSWLAGKPFED